MEMDVSKHLVFKGGTSLSKGWNLIERFSEDIDMALDRNFLGFSGELGVKVRKRLRKKSRQYITEEFFPALEQKSKDAGFTDVKLQIIDSSIPNPEPIQIEIHYPRVTEEPAYTKPRVILEIGSRSLREPFTTKTISTLVTETYPDKDFADKPIEVPTVNPERTFLEKVFLLHEEFQRPEEKMRVDRLSRHLYDLEKLMDTGFANNALNDSALYNDIVNHRRVFANMSGVNYDLHKPNSINPIPPDKVLSDWKKDYSAMNEDMIYGEALPFEDLINRIKKLKNRINKIEWKEKNTKTD